MISNFAGIGLDNIQNIREDEVTLDSECLGVGVSRKLNFGFEGKRYAILRY